MATYRDTGEPTQQGARSRSNGDEIDLVDLISILGRNWFKILLTLLVVLALALAYLALAEPLYTSKAKIFVDPKAKKIVSTELTPSGLGGDMALVESQVTIIKSEAVLRPVIEELKLHEDEEFVSQGKVGFLAFLRNVADSIVAIFASGDRANGSPDAAALKGDPTLLALRKLKRRLKVSRAKKTYVVEIAGTSQEPIKAMRLTKAIANGYLSHQANVKAKEARRATGLLETRLTDLRNRVRDAEAKVQAFRQANNIIAADGSLVNEQQLTRLNGEYITARGRTAEAKARYDNLQALLKAKNPGAISEAINSNLIHRLRTQYANAAQRVAALSATLKDQHPQLRRARSQLRALGGQITAELTRITTVAKNEYTIAKGREHELKIKLDQARKVTNKAHEAQITLRDLEREADANRAVLESFLSRAKETGEEQNISTPEAQIISPATYPIRPSKPKRLLVLALALFAGLGLGVVRVLLGEHLAARQHARGNQHEADEHADISQRKRAKKAVHSLIDRQNPSTESNAASRDDRGEHTPLSLREKLMQQTEKFKTVQPQPNPQREYRRPTIFRPEEAEVTIGGKSAGSESTSVAVEQSQHADAHARVEFRRNNVTPILRREHLSPSHDSARAVENDTIRKNGSATRETNNVVKTFRRRKMFRDQSRENGDGQPTAREPRQTVGFKASQPGQTDVRSFERVPPEVAKIPSFPSGLVSTPSKWARGGKSVQHNGQSRENVSVLRRLQDVLDPAKGVASPFRAAIFGLLHRIRQHRAFGEPRTVLLVSPNSGHGKSTLALSLAFAGQSIGERTLLIDADGLNPQLTRMLVEGPIEALEAGTSFDLNELLIYDSDKGFTLLPFSTFGFRFYGEAERYAILRELRQLVQDFDLVLVDGGALLEDDMAGTLSEFADETLMVVNRTRYNATDIVSAMDRLEEDGGGASGSVLTMSDADKP